MLKLKQEELIGISALLIHAAKIDEIYSEKEKKIVLNFITNNLEDSTLKDKVMKEAEKMEEDSNQLLNYTKIIKDSPLKIKKNSLKF